MNGTAVLVAVRSASSQKAAEEEGEEGCVSTDAEVTCTLQPRRLSCRLLSFLSFLPERAYHL